MKKLITLVIALVGLNGVASADIYNHGNHNDPSHTVANNTATLDCGNMSFSSCTNAVALEQFADQRCDSIIPNIDNSNTLPVYGSSYYHTVSQYGTDVISVIDQNGGIGPNSFDVTIIFGCKGYLHPAELQKL